MYSTLASLSAGKHSNGVLAWPPSLPGPTCGEVDVGKEDDVGGDQGDQLSDANLFFEVDMDDVLLPQGAVGAGVQQLEPGPEASEEPDTREK